MTRRISTIAAAMIFTFTTLFVMLDVTPADAMNCSSVCNQIRRACNHSAKGAFKAARIQCDEDRDGCKVDCVANAATCPGDCDTAASVCIAGCAGDATCEAACGDDLAQCQDDCINCEDNCDATRLVCKDSAKTARDATRTLCSELRGTCREICEDPIDAVCARQCTSDEHGCRADAKKAEGLCKKGCPSGSAKKACMRSCKKTNNLDQQFCEDTAVLCYADCADIDLTPTTTLP